MANQHVARAHGSFSILAFAIFVIVYFIAAVPNKDNGVNDTDTIMNFEDTADTEDINRLVSISTVRSLNTSDHCDKNQRDSDGDGVVDCDDQFPLMGLAFKLKDDNKPDCLRTQKNEGFIFKDYAFCDTQFNETTAVSSSINMNSKHIEGFRYLFNNHSLEPYEIAECINVFDYTLALGIHCDGDNYQYTKKEGTEKTHRQDHILCQKLHCCAMQNDQMILSSLNDLDYTDKAGCANFDFDDLWAHSTNGTDPYTVEFPADTTMSLTHFCSYTKSPTKGKDERECVPIADALTLYGREKDDKEGSFQRLGEHTHRKFPSVVV